MLKNRDSMSGKLSIDQLKGIVRSLASVYFHYGKKIGDRDRGHIIKNMGLTESGAIVFSSMMRSLNKRIKNKSKKLRKRRAKSGNLSASAK